MIFGISSLASLCSLLAAMSVRNHTQKLHKYSSRILILFLIVLSILTNIALILDDRFFGILGTTITVLPSIYIIYTVRRNKFINKTSQIVFHMSFSFWLWIVMIRLLLQ